MYLCPSLGDAVSDYKQAVGGRPPRYAPAQACKWWHNIRHVRIWIGHHYCMSMLACQYNQPKWPGDLGLWPFDLESGVRVMCDMGYLCANFILPRPLCSRLRSMYATDRHTSERQTSDKSIAYYGRGHNNVSGAELHSGWPNTRVGSENLKEHRVGSGRDVAEEVRWCGGSCLAHNNICIIHY